MKSEATREKRPYRMQARAQAAAETERRIFGAARELVAERPFAQVTLDDVAARAGVSVQTVIRRYGSKDGLIRAVAQQVRAEVHEQRFEAPGATSPPRWPTSSSTTRQPAARRSACSAKRSRCRC